MRFSVENEKNTIAELKYYSADQQHLFSSKFFTLDQAFKKLENYKFERGFAIKLVIVRQKIYSK